MRVSVVGGGVTGLVAAWDLAAAGASVTLWEGGDELGGKLRSSPFAGRVVDEGAEAFLVRLPEVTELADRLAVEVVHPVTTKAGVVVAGRVRPLPAGTVLGVPTAWRGLLPVLGPLGLARLAADLVLPGEATKRLPADPSVGSLVGARLGRKVVDRLVDPLLGGVYAGSADGLSTEVAAPNLLGARRSLLRHARATRPPPRPGPVFGSLAGGLGQLPGLLAGRFEAAGGRARLGWRVAQLRSAGAGWVVTGAGARGEHLEEQVDAVVLAVPAFELERLLAPLAAVELATPYADVALVTLAYPAGAADELPAGSGFLVPAREGLTLKAVTVMSAKWGWKDGPLVVRCSAGRYGQPAGSDDTELAGLLAAELAGVTGVTAVPVAARVTRWPQGLPQYRPGHRRRVAALRAALPEGIAVAGAGVDGVGLPACVRSGRAAAAGVLARR